MGGHHRGDQVPGRLFTCPVNTCVEPVRHTAFSSLRVCPDSTAGAKRSSALETLEVGEGRGSPPGARPPPLSPGGSSCQGPCPQARADWSGHTRRGLR